MEKKKKKMFTRLNHQEYDIETAQDIQEALRDLLGGIHPIHDGSRNGSAFRV